MEFDFDDHYDAPVISDPPDVPQDISESGRPRRTRRIPRRFLDAAPEVFDHDDDEMSAVPETPSSVEDPFCTYQTEFNRHGLRKVFRRLPDFRERDMRGVPSVANTATYQTGELGSADWLGPFPNESSYLLLKWLY